MRWHGKNINFCLILESISRKSKRSTNVNMQITTQVGEDSVMTAVCQRKDRNFLPVFNHQRQLIFKNETENYYIVAMVITKFIDLLTGTT